MKDNKINFEIRPTAYRAWDGSKMVPVNSLCWNAMGSIWYGPGNQFGWAWVNPEFNGWTNDNPKPTDADIRPVMQWTGFKDRNGKDIFEGDILSWEPDEELRKLYWEKGDGRGDLAITRWSHETHGGWIALIQSRYGGEGYEPLNHSGYRDEWIVLGNIFENPEFFEDQQ